MLDPTALFKMTYGLYVVSADDGTTRAGCLINTATQVTSSPLQIMVAVNKDNVTAGVVERAGAFTVTVVEAACKLVKTVDVGTHYLFIGEAVSAEKVGDGEPMTYSYYHSTLKGKTPPKASSYVAE